MYEYEYKDNHIHMCHLLQVTQLLEEAYLLPFLLQRSYDMQKIYERKNSKLRNAY